MSTNPLWYKDAIIYELHVRAFYDSDADGVGDFRGLVQKLEYVRDLGATALWLLPFYPSPLRDDGYDIADYTAVNPAYGSLRDFRVFLREARRQGLRVICEVVLNHTSDQHPWFRRARRAPPDSPERDFYVWRDTSDGYPDARVIFKDFETSNWSWDREAGAYYWHRFYSHQPDLNFDNPAVREAMMRVVDFWLNLGVDGLRLDAIPYLHEREGTHCENLPETHAFLRELRAHVDANFSDRMLLAEANQWPEEAAAYLGAGDECHMAFHFPLMPRMFMAMRMEDRFPIIDILDQTPAIPENAQWAMFLRNHDELTLEMVTDEERDYMYRVYAADPQARINLGIRRRLAPLLGNDRKAIELMCGLLLSMPGTPVLYYGDEIGMGDNIYLGDRNGVRTPMQWSADRNAGFSKANPQRMYLPLIIDPEYHAEAINVEAQQNNANSLLWWMKRIIALRKRYKAFGRGSVDFLYPANRKVLVFVRSYEEERVLVIANLSRQVQFVELDLGAFRGLVPVELFGGNEFPPIGELPYFLTLGPHDFYWFALTSQEEIAPSPRLPTLTVASWTDLLGDRARGSLEEVLPAYVGAMRWFRGKARKVKTVEVVEAVRVPGGGDDAQAEAFIALLDVAYTEGDGERYVLPLTVVRQARAVELEQRFPHSVVARLALPDGEALLVDATWEEGFAERILDTVAGRRRLGGRAGQLVGTTTSAFRRLRDSQDADLAASVLEAEQSNTSIRYGESFLLKLFRRGEDGTNPDLEIGRFLTEHVRFPHVAPVAGSIEYRSREGRSTTIGIVHGFVPNEGDAWRYTLDEVERFYERVQALPDQEEPPLPAPGRLVPPPDEEPPPQGADVIGHYIGSARLLGRRTAELHLALSSDPEHPDFRPEPFSTFDQRSLYQSMRSLTRRVFQLLREQRAGHPEVVQVLELEEQVLDRFRSVLDRRIDTSRIRCHGDYHLGQVLYTGRDFVIIDFEGEPARPMSERRIKRPALRDVAGMLRSFHYAAYTPFLSESSSILEEPSTLLPWAQMWTAWISRAFLGSYVERAAGAPFVPASDDALDALLDALLLEKAIYELGYEANNRPQWLKIPIQGVIDLVEHAP